MIGKLRIAMASALVLAAGNAWALGLGQIQVKSQRNQPLLAEIPIVSITPGELQALQARLASPETFRRVGLSPPSGLAADLQFSLGNDAQGRPVIRVTTLRPVDQSVLSFLIEVDWGQGRLVREYSALIDVPQTASAPVTAAVQVPETPDAAVVQRAPVATPAAVPEPAPAQPEPVPASEPAPVAARSDIAPAPVAPAAPVASAARVAASAQSASQYGPVKRGESLSAIASKLELRQSASLEQTMLALLRANPEAFLGDDINLLRQGAVLRLPSRGEAAAIDAGEASQVVRQQMRQWRARRAVRQPEVAAAPTAGEAGNRAVASDAQPAAPRTGPTKAATAPRRSEARLQIVPAAAPGTATGTRTGTAAGGEGSMQQQLRQRDEDIAAKSAEISELKERVAELERLKDEQQRLISLKDSELAAAQQRLQEARSAPAAASATAPQPAVQAPAPQQQPASMVWWWAGLGLLLAAGLAWLLTGRRNRAATPAARRKVFDTEALAAGLEPPRARAAASPEDVQAPAVVPPPVRDLQASTRSAPGWHAPEAEKEAPPPVTAVTGVPPQATAAQRIKLARAFLDVGDGDSARQLLRELLDDADSAAREDAARMLRELG